MNKDEKDWSQRWGTSSGTAMGQMVAQIQPDFTFVYFEKNTTFRQIHDKYMTRAPVKNVKSTTTSEDSDLGRKKHEMCLSAFTV